MAIRRLNHQTQLHEKGCVSACLAMLLDKPVAEVEAEFHERYMDSKLDVDEYLHMNGMGCLPALSTLGRKGFLSSQVYYLTTVPSLHYPAVFHQVVMYWEDEDWVLLDPNYGYEGRQYYVMRKTDFSNRREVELRSYAIDYEVWDK